MSSSADRNLLFGILAMQMDFVSREQLIAATSAWVLEKQTPLDELLARQGALNADHRDLLTALVAAHLKQHADDPEKSLAAVSSIESVRTELLQIADPEIEASLVHVSENRPDTDASSSSGVDPHATQSMGESTSDGVRFRILRPHAKGGLGEVFVAADAELGREVALKQIQQHRADDPNSRSRFVLEAEITGGLEHPGIVPVYGLGTYANGRPFYAMRFIRGDSLKDAIQRFHTSDAPSLGAAAYSSVAFRKLLGRFIDVCNAIEYAHSRGVLHRDLKPGNIMLGKYGETLVVDWGLAKALGKTSLTVDAEEAPVQPTFGSGSAPTQMGSAIGTPQFMSPEQAAGRVDLLGPESDVYSLGATLYCSLTGEPPLAAQSDIGEILRSVKSGKIPPPRSIKPSITNSLEAICLKAMSLKPADRYASPRALADDIEHWLADEPVTALPDTLSAYVARVSRRHRAWVRAAVASLLILTIGSIVGALLINVAKNGAVAAEKKAVAQRDRAEALAYSGRLAVAQLELQFGDSALTMDILESCPRGLRGWEHDYLYTRVSTKQRTLVESLLLKGHSDIVLCAAYSPDGTRIASGGGDGELKIWDANTGTPLPSLTGHTGPVYSVAYSPNGKHIASGGGSWPGELKVWNAETGVEIRSLQGHKGSVTGVAYSPDGRHIASVSDTGEQKLWDAKSGAEIQSRLEPGHIFSAVAYSPDGKRIAGGDSSGNVHVWSADTGDVVLSFAGHTRQVTCVAYSPDGTRIVSGAGNRDGGAGDAGEVKLWDAETGAEVHSMSGHSKRVSSVTFSPDGKRIASASWDNTVKLWDAASGVEVFSFKPHIKRVSLVAFDHLGKQLLTASWDRTLKTWDAAGSDKLCSLKGHTLPVTGVAISPDGNHVVSCSASLENSTRPGEVMLWDIERGQELALTGHEGAVYGVAYSPDGKRITCASASMTGTVWNADTGAVALSFKTNNSPWASCVAYSPDCKYIVAGGRAGLTVRVTTGSEVQTLAWPHLSDSRNLTCVVFSPDGKRVAGATASMSKTAPWPDADPAGEIMVFPVDGQQPILALNGHTCVAFSPDGNYVVGASQDNELKIWDSFTGAEVRSLGGHTRRVTSVIYSPNGERIVGGNENGTVIVWDAGTGAELDSYRGHTARVSSVTYSLDGKFIVSGSYDGTLKIWLQ